jgi:hypothetical protein
MSRGLEFTPSLYVVSGCPPVPEMDMAEYAYSMRVNALLCVGSCGAHCPCNAAISCFS